MASGVHLENGPPPDEEFLNLIRNAAQEKGDGDKPIPDNQDYVVIDITPPYKAVITHFVQTLYPKVRYRSMDPATLDLTKFADPIFLSRPQSSPRSLARRLPPSAGQSTNSSTPRAGFGDNTTYGNWEPPSSRCKTGSGTTDLCGREHFARIGWIGKAAFHRPRIYKVMLL